jgi:hypothetical protein
MNEEEYLKSRVDNQIKWYSTKSAFNKKMFNRLKMAEIILALSIPLLVYIVAEKDVNFSVSLIGVTVAVIAGLISLMKYQENWIEYRTTAETLKHEKYLYITKSGPYDGKESFNGFVERIEGVISKENSKWSKVISAKEKENPTG